MNTNSYVLIANRTLAKHIGLEQALVLQQIKFWIDLCGKEIDTHDSKWIYNSLKEWHQQFSFWSLSKLRRVIKSLEKQKLIISKKINSKKWNQTKWYSINLDEYDNMLGNFDNEYLIDKKRTDRFVQKEQILYNETKSNYTNKSSYKKEKSLLIKNKAQNLTNNNFTTKNTMISQEQEHITKQMVQVWNKCFEYSLNPVKAFVNKNVSEQLNRILQTKFDNNLENWKLYAQKVNSSKFLMGEKETKSGFKAQFLWLIKEETIDSIQNGAYGVGDRLSDSDKIDENLKVCQKEVQQMIQDKLEVKIQENIFNECEEKEFTQYLKNREYDKDGDKYLLQKHMKSIGSQYMYGGYITPSHVFYSGNEKYRKRLFQTYLMKKYYDVDENMLSSFLAIESKIGDKKSTLLKFKSIREKLKFGMLKDINKANGVFRGLCRVCF